MASGQILFSSPFSIVEILGQEQIDLLVSDALESGSVSVDTETTGLRWSIGEIPFMATFAANTQRAFFTYLEPKLTLETLQQLESSGVEFDFWNAKFDLHQLREGCAWNPDYRSLRYNDSMLLQRIVSPNTSARLKVASTTYTPEESLIDVDGPEKLVKAWLSDNQKRERIGGKYIVTWKPNYSHVPADIMIPYAAQDVILTMYARQGLKPIVKSSSTLTRTAEREMKLCSVVLSMEQAGWPVNRTKLKALAARAREILSENTALFNAAVGPDLTVNPFSNPALADYLYNVRKYDPLHHITPAGNPSCDDAALRDLPDADVREPLLKLRKWKKRLEKCDEFAYYLTDHDRVHTVYNMVGAKTGRFSSEAPQLHNAERPNPEDPTTSIRDVVEARPGYSLLFVDYSAIEMRLFAHYSRDSVLVKAFNEGTDAHLLVASMMYGLPMAAVSKLQRTFAKTISFTILFGGSTTRIKNALLEGAGGNEPMSRAEAVAALSVLRPNINPGPSVDVFEMLAAALHDAYKTAFPSVKKFVNRAKETVNARQQLEGQGYVVNMFGRRVFIAPGKGYVAVNALIQSTAADLMKESMNRIDDALNATFNTYQQPDGCVLFIGTIHDELVFEVKDECVEAVANLVGPILVTYPEIGVPLEVKFSISPHGVSWAGKKDLELAA